MHLINIVAPIFLIIALGVLLRHTGVIRVELNAVLSKLVFFVAAPALLFKSTSQNHFDWGLYRPVLLVVAAITITIGLGVYAAAYRMNPRRRGVIAQGALRSNTVFFGLPVMINAFGEAALGPISVIIAFMVIVENMLSVLVLTLPHQNLSARDGRLWLVTIGKLLRNPLLIGCGAGILVARLGLPQPLALTRSVELIGGMAAPLGLLCLGAGMDFSYLRKELGISAMAASLRLLLHPAAAFLILRGMGFSGLELAVPVIVIGCPTAVMSFIMAREMNGDAQLASAIVIGTTLLSMVTIPGWLILLRYW